ncbi:hypothetical protein ACIRF8_18995 [Streptomyces sp. NPDC102406]|uniref:hypothetical protein n=1 Tax=Streptomyces sp. NPDC102406 TaxID=3366171 RepID=UPI00381E40A4
MDEEEFMRGRVYGADHEDAGPRPWRAYAQLVGGPLDGLLLDVTDRLAEEARGVVALPTELGAFGPGGRALYGPVDAAGRRLAWQGDAP